MEKKYFLVKAKCGHVGKRNFIVIDFPIFAVSAKEAASIARNIGRVKHHHQDAIISVIEVDQKTYEQVNEQNKMNPYLKAKCKQDQKSIYLEEELIQNEPESERKRTRNIPIRLLKQLLSVQDFDPSEYNEMKHVYLWKTRHAFLD